MKELNAQDKHEENEQKQKHKTVNELTGKRFYKKSSSPSEFKYVSNQIPSKSLSDVTPSFASFEVIDDDDLL